MYRINRVNPNPSITYYTERLLFTYLRRRSDFLYFGYLRPFLLFLVLFVFSLARALWPLAPLLAALRKIEHLHEIFIQRATVCEQTGRPYVRNEGNRQSVLLYGEYGVLARILAVMRG